MLIRLAEEMGFKIATFQHVLEGYKVAEGDRDARRRRLDVLRLVGLQGRGRRRHPVQRRASCTSAACCVSINSDSAEHARRLNTEAAKIDEVGRPDRGRGARDGHDQPGEAAAHRQPRRLARGRQGRRRRDLEPPSAQHLRHRRSRLHRRAAVLRPQGRRAPADRRRARRRRRSPRPKGGRAGDDRTRRRRRRAQPAARPK